MFGKYILDTDGNPKLEPDLLKWAQWYESHERHVAEDYVGNVRVSTIFLGLDSAFFSWESPLLWETMIFGGEHDTYQERYRSREDAIAGHAKALELVKQ